jgi:predicted TIM-barrel enzyme
LSLTAQLKPTRPFPMGARAPVRCGSPRTARMARPLPPLIAALQLPPFRPARPGTFSYYEDFLLSNARTFVEGGIGAIKIQDETREAGPAAAETVAMMGALARGFRREFPDTVLGIIVQAHDAVAPLAIANAADADFVRLKIFVGAAVNAEGPRSGLAVEALDCRRKLGRTDVAILADAHDRTSVPLAPVADTTAALWVQQMGADGVILTGGSFADTLGRVRHARAAGVTRPILVGGGVDAGNVAEALATADGAIVSTSLLRKDAAPTDLIRWDRDAVRQLVDAAESAR